MAKKRSPEDRNRAQRAREVLLEAAERELAKREGRDPRPLPRTNAEYREWRKPHDAHLEQLRQRWLAELSDRS